MLPLLQSLVGKCSHALFCGLYSYTEELARFLLMWIGVLGASIYAYRTRTHPELIFLSEDDSTIRHSVPFLIEFSVLITALSLLVIMEAVLLVNLSFALDQRSAALGINMGFYLLYTDGSVLITL